MAMTAALDLSPDDFDVISPSVYARHGYPHDEWRRAPRIARPPLPGQSDRVSGHYRADRLSSNLVGGIKRLPIRYKLRSA
jgi:hypothetical protein